jgi:hypothetical protein
MLLYNTEWEYGHGMAVNYHGKKFYNIGSRAQCYKTFNHGISMVIPSFCVIKQHYLGNYCGMAVTYHSICVTNVIKHNLT